MSRVTFKHKSGRVEVMHERYAVILQRLNRGTYLTRALQAEPVGAPDKSEPLFDDPVAVGPDMPESKSRTRSRKRKTKTAGEQE